MDQRQSGYSSVKITGRTTHEIRDTVRFNIDKFFNSALEKIPEPNLEKEFSKLLEEYKTPDGVHPVFFRRMVSSIKVSRGRFKLLQPLPEGKYCSPKEGSRGTIIEIKEGQQLPENVERYVDQCSKLEEARDALKDAAYEALRETSLKNAVKRLPELEKFL